MNQPQDQFSIAWAQFVKEQRELESMPRATHRLYYDDAGAYVDIHTGPPWPPMDYKWIEITSDQVERCNSQTKVINGRLVFVDIRSTNVVKLTELVGGEHMAVNGHMAIVLDDGESYEDVKQYTKQNSRHSRP